MGKRFYSNSDPGLSSGSNPNVSNPNFISNSNPNLNFSASNPQSFSNQWHSNLPFNRPVLSVTQLNHQLKGFIEPNFQNLLVKGEISRPVYHSSGHLYFILKDSGGVINGAMWRSYLKKVPVRFRGGEQVVVEGNISLYPPRGEYKIIATSILLLNRQGGLEEELERLKRELYQLGYFDKRWKKRIPPFPSKIAIITSKTGAALQDMLRIARHRWKLTKFYIIDALVQGPGAGVDIARKIAFADQLGVDLIVIGRGGGSREDLWAFNERVVADAIFKAKTPIISAVGHEIDYLISDFVADQRAATPSNSMEIALPDQNEILYYLDQLMEQLQKGITRILFQKREQIDRRRELLQAYSPLVRLERLEGELKWIENRFGEKIGQILEGEREKLKWVRERLEERAPAHQLKQKKEEVEELKNRFQRELKWVKWRKREELFRLAEGWKGVQLIKNILERKREEVQLLKREIGLKIERVITQKGVELKQIKTLFLKSNPELKVKKYFAEIRRGGELVELETLNPGDEVELYSPNCQIRAIITSSCK